ncbi:MAG: LysR family transcriptional regulator [Massiliimalia sp.]|jgi:DNA-binding transcriptional LysR family regulator
MTIRHLRIFIEVAESGKMSLAANKFFLSQPTVSQVIAELEEHYHTRLFERLSKKLYITDSGRTLLHYAKQVVSSFDDLEYTMLHSFSSQPLRIGASVTVGTCLVNPIIDEFHKSNPDTEVEVHVNNTHIIEELLLNSQLDLALVEGKIKSPNLTVTPVIDDFLVLVCGKDHPFAQRNVVCLQELSKEKFILREAGSGTRELFETYMKAKNVPIQVSWICNNSEAIKNAILDNHGISVISARLLEKEIREGSIHIVRVQDCLQYSECIWKREFSLVIHKNKYITPAMSAMLDTIQSFRDDNIFDLLPNLDGYQHLS